MTGHGKRNEASGAKRQASGNLQFAICNLQFAIVDAADNDTKPAAIQAKAP
jgi:hypothetical protein